MDCDTRDTLQSVFQPYNERLYAQLDTDAEIGLRPPEEPTFGRFGLCKCSEGREVRKEDSEASWSATSAPPPSAASTAGSTSSVSVVEGTDENHGGRKKKVRGVRGELEPRSEWKQM